jgi:hypothetical protein
VAVAPAVAEEHSHVGRDLLFHVETAEGCLWIAIR